MEKKDRLETKEKSISIKKESVKSHEEADTIQKTESGIEGPPIKKIIESMSEPEKPTGPNPNA